MSHTEANLETVRRGLEREIVHNRNEATRRRQEAVRLLGEARLLELEADHFARQLEEVVA